jgi:L-ascorbate metabolism protein UlaG (beta-lactamase superfamily)
MMTNKKQDPITSKRHHTAKGFKHDESFKIKISEFLRWRLARKVLPPKMGYDGFNQLWSQQVDLSLPDDRVWWIGHSTTLSRLGGKMILTDPIFSQRASPLQLIGPKRRTLPALDIEQLPKIDFIVISHNHYDHFDYPSIRQLLTRFPHVVIMVPLGLKRILLKWGAKNVVELDWWDCSTIDGLTFSATPAIHWSNRGLFDVNKALWCGWMIEAKTANQNQTKTVYFMGDTCYSAELKEIAKRFPSINLALIPIGAYAPRWYMQSQHIDPKQAVQLYDELQCQSAIAIHWGAFELADEPLDEPAQLLNDHKADRAFYLLKIGGTQAINHFSSDLE